MRDWKQIGVRVIIHGLLAVFLANAANKFFVADLEYELEHGFYKAIFNFVGDAPDQYRVLPLIPLDWLCDFLPFNHAVLVYNFIFTFVVLELFLFILRPMAQKKIFAVALLFVLGYNLCQFSGWRPDTMGLLFFATLLVLPLKLAGNLLSRPAAQSLLTLGLIGLAFCRADVAMVYAFFLAIYQNSHWTVRMIWLMLPVGVQILLQFVLFPDATYYSKTVMVMDNLSGYYLLRHPATYLIVAVVLLWGKQIKEFIQASWKYKWFYFALVGYLGLVFVIGRLNEYRLYLPFLPLFFFIWNEKYLHEKASLDTI